MVTPNPGPYRPHPRPHLARTAVLLALIGAVLIAIVLVTSYFIGPATAELPLDDYTGTYNPGLYTPFTHPPESPR